MFPVVMFELCHSCTHTHFFYDANYVSLAMGLNSGMLREQKKNRKKRNAVRKMVWGWKNAENRNKKNLNLIERNWRLYWKYSYNCYMSNKWFSVIGLGLPSKFILNYSVNIIYHSAAFNDLGVWSSMWW